MVLCHGLIGEVIEHRLAALELYREGGEATRVVQRESAPPPGMWILEGLPGNLSAEGIRVRVVEPAGLRLGGFQFDRLPPAERDPDPRLEKLLEDRRGLEEERTDLTSRIEALSRRIALHQSIQENLIKALEETESGETPVQIWQNWEAEQEVRDQMTRLERELQPRIEDLNRKIEQVNRRIREAERRYQALNGQLILQILESGQGPVQLEVVLPMRDCGWMPRYRVDARPAESRWDLDFQAEISNQTGEDWEGVDLSLLTGRPHWRLEAPDLPPVYLAKPSPQKPELASAPRLRAESMALASADLAEPPAPAFTSERLTTRFRLEVDEPVSIEAYQPGKVIELSRIHMDAAFWSAATPALEETAYLHGEARLEAPWPLLPGPAILLVDGTVTGRSSLPYRAPGDTLELGFGPNPAIIIEHAVREVKDRDSGLFDKVRKYQRHYHSTARNLMEVPHTVHLQSRFPLSRDEAISIERIEPENPEVDPETGRFRWEATLAPGETRSFDTRFEVTAPRDWALLEGF